jgi:hypothetical protein
MSIEKSRIGIGTPTTLGEALESRLVFVDGSVGSFNHQFCKTIFDYWTYDSFKLDDLTHQQQSSSHLISLLKQPNVATIPEITEEMLRYYDIIREKIDFIERYHNRNPLGRRLSYTESRKLRAKSQTRKERVKILLGKLRDQAFLMCQLSRQSEVDTSDPRYELLTQMISEIDEALPLEKDPANQDSLYPFTTRPSEKDRKTAAVLYFQALNSDTPVALLSEDKHFVRLLGSAPRILSSRAFSPYNQEGFVNRLSTNPFYYYRPSNSKRSIVYEHSVADLVHLERQNKIPREKRPELKARLLELWKQFSIN